MTLVEQTLASEEAKQAFMSGWSIEEIRKHICVDCGALELPDYSNGFATVQSGFRTATRRNGTRHVVGYLCGKCMANPTP